MPEVTARAFHDTPPATEPVLRTDQQLARPGELDRVLRTYSDRLQAFPARMEIKRYIEVASRRPLMGDDEFRGLRRVGLTSAGDQLLLPESEQADEFDFALSGRQRSKLVRIVASFLQEHRLPQPALERTTFEVFANVVLSVKNRRQIFTSGDPTELQIADFDVLIRIHFSTSELLRYYERPEPSLKAAMAEVRKTLRTLLPLPNVRGAPRRSLPQVTEWLVRHHVLRETYEAIAAGGGFDPSYVGSQVRTLLGDLDAIRPIS